MTDDEKAEIVLEALVGIRRCPICGIPMDLLPSRSLHGPLQFWVCDGKDSPHAQQGRFICVDYD